MCGTCGVSSRLGEGSTFWFTIRVGTTAGEVTHTHGSDPGLAGVTALVVDDNATQRHVLAEKMTEWGMAVTTAESGETAIATLRTAAAQSRPFAVALLDRSMPGIDGLELAAAIAADPALTTRLVLMTGLSREADAGDDVPPGISTTLSKPVHRDILRGRLRVALGLQVATPALRHPRHTDRRRPAGLRWDACSWPRTIPSTRRSRWRCCQRRLSRRHRARRRRRRAGSSRAAVRRGPDGLSHARDGRLRGHGRNPALEGPPGTPRSSR